MCSIERVDAYQNAFASPQLGFEPDVASGLGELKIRVSRFDSESLGVDHTFFVEWSSSASDALEVESSSSTGKLRLAKHTVPVSIVTIQLVHLIFCRNHLFYS